MPDAVSSSATDRTAPSGRARSGLAILCDRLDGLERWLADSGNGDGPPSFGSREQELDDRRRADVRSREQAALLQWLDAHGSASAPPASPVSRTLRAVIVHPEDHARTVLTGQLQRQGFEAVLTTEHAPGAIGHCVLEQPDAVVIAATCQTMTCHEAIRQLRHYCARSLLVVCDAPQERIAAVLEAGADVVYSRTIGREQMCRELTQLLLQ